MIDLDETIRDYLASIPMIAALTGGKVYAGTSLPIGYQPSLGPAILLAARGGRPDYLQVLLRPSIQLRAYAATLLQARDLDRAIYDGVHDKAGHRGFVKWARCDVLGQALEAPETGWPFVLSYYTFTLANP